jgi:hypothetical protein
LRLSKNQRRFAPIGGRFETELMAGFTGIPRRKLGDIGAAISVVGLGLFVLGEVTEIAFRRKSKHLTPELLTNWIKTSNLEELSKLPGYRLPRSACPRDSRRFIRSRDEGLKILVSRIDLDSYLKRENSQYV